MNIKDDITKSGILSEGSTLGEGDNSIASLWERGIDSSSSSHGHVNQNSLAGSSVVEDERTVQERIDMILGDMGRPKRNNDNQSLSTLKTSRFYFINFFHFSS